MLKGFLKGKHLRGFLKAHFYKNLILFFWVKSRLLEVLSMYCFLSFLFILNLFNSL